MVKSILLLACLSLPSIINGQSLSKEAIQSEVASMIRAGDFNVDILQISEPINNVQAVLVNLP